MAMLMQQSALDNETLLADKKKLENKLRELDLLESSTLTSSAEDTAASADASNDTSLQRRIKQLESSLNEMKQAAEKQSNEVTNLKSQLETAQQHQTKLKQVWEDERTSLREEVRRLNIENSRYRNEDIVSSSHNIIDDEEEEEWTKKYQLSCSQSKDRAESLAAIEEMIYPNDASNNDSSNPIHATSEFDSSDISCLQSIIATLRQTIHQITTEKEMLKQRLTEEQSRSQHELHSFAKTLEGVDDLRKSAERMSRELRRIKVQGCKPTRSDLINSNNNSRRNSDEFQMADEASKEMENAMRLIECQNDALNDRWSGTTDVNDIKIFASVSKRTSMDSCGSAGLSKLSEDDDGDNTDGFMSYWRKDEDGEEGMHQSEKKKRAKEKKKKKKSSSGASVFTSFF